MFLLLSLSASALTLGSTYEPSSVSITPDAPLLFDAQDEDAGISRQINYDAEHQYTSGRLMYYSGVGGLMVSTALFGGGAFLVNEMDDGGSLVLGVLSMVVGVAGGVVSIPLMSGGALLVGRSTHLLDESASPLMGQLSVGCIALSVGSLVVLWIDLGNPNSFLAPVTGYLAAGGMLGAVVTGAVQIAQSKRVWRHHAMTLSLTPTLSADDLGVTATIRW